VVGCSIPRVPWSAPRGVNLVGQEVSGRPQDANAARAAYRSLREHLRDLGVEGEVAGELAQLLDRHLDTLDGALAGTGAEGLGPAAGCPAQPRCHPDLRLVAPPVTRRAALAARRRRCNVACTRPTVSSHRRDWGVVDTASAPHRCA
jgi:hypothetical protein